MIVLILLQELDVTSYNDSSPCTIISIHLFDKKRVVWKRKKLVNNIILSFCLRNIKLKLNWVSLLFTLCKRDIFQSPSE